MKNQKSLFIILLSVISFAAGHLGHFEQVNLPYYHLGPCSLEFGKSTHYTAGQLSEGLESLTMTPSNGYPLQNITMGLIAFGAVNANGEYLEGQGYSDGRTIQVMELRSIHRADRGEWVLTILKSK